VPIDRSGRIPIDLVVLPEMLRENCKATASFFEKVGYEPPWIGYVAMHEGRAVGGGAFKGPPRDNRVEIAYYTLPELERRGHATATARELVRIARATDPGIVVTARTLPVTNASNALLKKVGFAFMGSVVDPEDGEVWEWQLAGGCP
jgi:RimJ/RimL family protein N-acetyltransferase